MKAYRRLPLTGLLNARDLGGYPTPEGITRYGVFLRSDLPQNVTQEDIALLREWGLTLDVDLRGGPELKTRPDALAGESWLEYRQLSMFELTAAGAMQSDHGPAAFEEGFFWGDEYIRMIENHHDWVRRVLEAMAEAPGGAMFHCATGKDRTGVMAALLLGLCDVSDDDIAADYALSECYLLPIYNRLLPHIPEGMIQSLDAPFFSTAPKNIRAFTEHLRREYGSINGFLDACDVSGDVRDCIRGKLIERL